MATDAQIEANRKNAEKSTGPITPEGKASSSKNATRHGFCSNGALLSEESRIEFDEFLNALRKEHQPVGSTETVLVYKMAQSAYFTWQTGKFLSERLDQNDHEHKQLALMLRYYNTSDRAFNRNLTDLRKLQKERKIEGIGFVSQTSRPQPVQTPPTGVDWPAATPFDDETQPLDVPGTPKTPATPPKKAA